MKLQRDIAGQRYIRHEFLVHGVVRRRLPVRFAHLFCP